MAELVRLPMAGQSMEEGTITRWHVKEGDTVSVGDLLLEVMTDKANVEVHSTVSGSVRRLLVSVDQTVPVKTPIAIVGDPEEDISPLLELNGHTVADNDVAQGQPASAYGRMTEERIAASPRARRLASEVGVDLRPLVGKGSGAHGRIIESDIRALLHNRPKATPVAERIAARSGVSLNDVRGTGAGGRVTKGDLPINVGMPTSVVSQATSFGRKTELTGLRKLTADAVTRSYRTAPHVTLVSETDCTKLVELRGLVVESLERRYGFRLTYTDLIVKAAALALAKFPSVNAMLSGNEIVLLDRVNVGVAVAVEGALVVPVIREADRKLVTQIALESRELAERARERRSAMEDLEGGTFTVSNLGSHGVDLFTPILTPGQTGILGVCRIQEKPVARNGVVEVRPTTNLCLSFDHRVVDGTPAAEFLSELRALIEDPALMLL